SGSFLPSLGRRTTTVYSGRRSQHCYEIKCQFGIDASSGLHRPMYIPSHDWLRHRRGRTRALAGSGLGGGGGEVGDQEFHDGVRVFGAAFEAVVGGLQGLKALEKASFGNFAGGLPGEVRLFQGIYSRRGGG